MHRDLAARNMLVDNGYKIKIADFGLTRCVEAGDAIYRSTGLVSCNHLVIVA